MLAALLSLLGVGGIAGIALRLFGWAGTVAKVKKVPPKVWIALAIFAALVGAFFWHQHVAGKALKARYAAGDAAGYARAKAEDKAAADRIAARARSIEGKGREVTKKVEERHAQSLDRIHADARALRLRQPPGSVFGQRRSGQTVPGLPDAAGSGDGAVPGAIPGLAQVPWLDLVDHGERCDVDRAKLKALQDWIKLESKAFSNDANPGGK